MDSYRFVVERRKLLEVLSHDFYFLGEDAIENRGKNGLYVKRDQGFELICTTN
jgi:hypothetical protein